MAELSEEDGMCVVWQERGHDRKYSSAAGQERKQVSRSGCQHLPCGAWEKLPEEMTTRLASGAGRGGSKARGRAK